MTPNEKSRTLERKFAGVLLGTAVGDALGLPAENMSPQRIHRLWQGDWRMRLVCGRGMISDDTEHTLMVAQALLSHRHDASAFQRALAWKLRWWFASLPAGIGLATAKACIRLWMGFPPHKAGVASAGSGPAMRSAIIGAYFANNPKRRREFVEASSRITHRSWQADAAALAVAECTALAITSGGMPDAESVLDRLRSLAEQPEWQAIVSQIESAVRDNFSVADFVQMAGIRKGVTGYALHVVPVAIYSWLRYPNDFRKALVQVLQCGGDTDTAGAVVGAITGAVTGQDGIPAEWLNGIAEWPRSVTFMKRIAAKLGQQSAEDYALGPVPYFWPCLLARNVLFLTIILTHGLRRLAPPYGTVSR